MVSTRNVLENTVDVALFSGRCFLISDSFLNCHVGAGLLLTWVTANFWDIPVGYSLTGAMVSRDSQGSCPLHLGP